VCQSGPSTWFGTRGVQENLSDMVLDIDGNSVEIRMQHLACTVCGVDEPVGDADSVLAFSEAHCGRPISCTGTVVDPPALVGVELTIDIDADTAAA
jgi:hypothetical protein